MPAKSGWFIYRPNTVVQRQKAYQAAFRAHQRLWLIPPGNRYIMIPYAIVFWGTLSASIYALGRKVLGHNTFFGEN